jgi:hypothetical protein
MTGRRCVSSVELGALELLKEISPLRLSTEKASSSAHPVCRLQTAKGGRPSPGTGAEHPQPARRRRCLRQRRETIALSEAAAQRCAGTQDAAFLLSTGSAGQPATPTTQGHPASPALLMEATSPVAQGRREACIPGSASWPECETAAGCLKSTAGRGQRARLAFHSSAPIFNVSKYSHGETG